MPKKHKKCDKNKKKKLFKIFIRSHRTSADCLIARQTMGSAFMKMKGSGMMRTGENIFKRKDGRWEARYHKERTASGKLLYGFCYGKTYSEAKARMERAKFPLYIAECDTLRFLTESKHPGKHGHPPGLKNAGIHQALICWIPAFTGI